MTIYRKYSSDNYQRCGRALREALSFGDTSEWLEKKRRWLFDLGITEIRGKSVRSKDVRAPSVNHRFEQAVRSIEKYSIEHLVNYQIDFCAGRVLEFNDGEQSEFKLDYPPPNELIGNRISRYDMMRIHQNRS